MAKLTTELSSATYECMVCVDKIRQDASVWSCRTCYAVFHLRCIREWAQRSQTDANQNTWRCPGCQGRQTDVPTEYRCFCGKTKDPLRSGYFAPHSCGDICGRLREGTSCPHRCTIPCHPGPCPPCPVVLPPKPCFCGATTYTVGCGQPDPGVACGTTCGKVLGCGTHTCTQPCHAGDCAPCAVRVTLPCYGHHAEEERPCGDEKRGDPSGVSGGYFACGQTCQRVLACGCHRCAAPCHSGACAPCALLPEAVRTCPCGKHVTDELLARQGKPPRASCDEPVPTCGERCGRPLACGLDGHVCPDPCHTGPCRPCRMPRTVRCRCGAEERTLPCSNIPEPAALEKGGEDADARAITCGRLCRALRSCGRHQCGRRCCPGTAAAHECPLPCNKRLQCGLHNCERTCHKGHCGRCIHTIYEELVCPCGRTFLEPPQPCGTVLPPCPHTCTRYPLV